MTLVFFVKYEKGRPKIFMTLVVGLPMGLFSTGMILMFHVKG